MNTLLRNFFSFCGFERLFQSERRGIPPSLSTLSRSLFLPLLFPPSSPAFFYHRSSFVLLTLSLIDSRIRKEEFNKRMLLILIRIY